ncbi:hypothetical protein CAPTEDRAFT_127501 [Capitella teleta]|uniref:Sulfatase N-terminal domain-containing protein n=1 Tax=Capitella teleta TaxID=283909 RepID=R7TCZ2_CAPTE|nr:hypothetical protein CAPTEDRAFT_127501 [Capitella teleta]|eukprot:ELT91599.1 hypothetical protein CAPTEDRAFT_127501 [Capitella teleta]
MVATTELARRIKIKTEVSHPHNSAPADDENKAHVEYARDANSAEARSPAELPTVEQTNFNVLYIIADDLRPEIGAFIDPKTRPWLNSAIKTPNLDALAERSLVLRRAYVQVARCNPSRVSIMTSRRPNTTHIVNNDGWFRKVGHGNTFVTIPEYFKMNGYSTLGCGKVFHPKSGVMNPQDQGRSWTKEFFQPKGHYEEDLNISWKAVSINDTMHKPLRDQMSVKHALSYMQYEASRFNTNKSPFFLAVGLKKPHVPYVFPDEFLDLYPIEDIQLPQNDFAPANMPACHWHNSRDTLGYDDLIKAKKNWVINSTLPTNVAIDLRRAYYASVSYIDSLVGTLLAELDKLQLRERTIVAFLSDHGYQLGEHGIWGKDTNFEAATNAPMMLSIPGKTDKRVDSFRMTEMVDLFPTLVDAAGLPPLPQCPQYSEETAVCTEGSSMMPLLQDSSSADPIKWKDRVFSQYPSPDIAKAEYMGYSVRTEKYLYIEWVRCKGEINGVWPQPTFKELYDIDKDINQNRNVVNDSIYANTIVELSQSLRDGWVAALPKLV